MIVCSLEEEYDGKVKELQRRHELELRALDQNGNGGAGGLLESLNIGDNGAGHSAASSAVPTSSNQQHNDDEERRLAKLERLRAKREAERARALERERAMQQEFVSAAGKPTRRGLELQAILSTVTPLGYTVQPVTADGHCLYRAIAGHVASVPNSTDPVNFQTIRA
jgi:hypothetical protein